MKPIFLYLRSAKPAPDALRKLGEEGYIVMGVKQFSDVKIIDPLLLEGAMNPLAKAAFEVINQHNCKDNLGVRTAFGSKIAAHLAMKK